MLRRPLVAVAVLAAIATVACQKNGGGGADPSKVDALDAKLTALDERLARLEGFLGPYLDQPPPPPEPDPQAVYAVPIEGAPSRGPATALVTIVQGYEFACGFCEKVRSTLAQLQSDYGDKIRIVYKHFVVHPDIALAPALAVCAAAEQGKFAALEPLIWEKGFKERDLSVEHMARLAEEAKLDMARYQASLEGDTCTRRIAEDQADLQRFGVNGTPAFYINGRHLSGAQPIANFKRIIDEELAKAEQAIEAGTAPADYYRVAVLDKGLKELARPGAKP